MSYSTLTDQELLDKIQQSIKKCKLCQLYLKDVCDDYGKYKIAKLKFEFARHEYISLLREAKARGIEIGEDSKKIANSLFH